MNIENILNKNYILAKEEIFAKLNEIKENRLIAFKKIVSENLVEEDNESIEEANVVRQGRIKLIKIRIRGGKVQRRVKKAAIKGYTLKKGKIKRITAAERIKMKRVQKRAAIKRRSKMRRAIIKRKRSMRKLRALGVR